MKGKSLLEIQRKCFGNNLDFMFQTFYLLILINSLIFYPSVLTPHFKFILYMIVNDVSLMWFFFFSALESFSIMQAVFFVSWFSRDQFLLQCMFRKDIGDIRSVAFFVHVLVSLLEFFASNNASFL